jgi:hypothetical protein
MCLGVQDEGALVEHVEIASSMIMDTIDQISPSPTRQKKVLGNSPSKVQSISTAIILIGSKEFVDCTLLLHI